MANNANSIIIPISAGVFYSGNDLGNNLTGSCVNQIQCLTAGSIIINAFGSGTATFPLTAGQTVDILIGSCSAITGTYAAFKTLKPTPGMSNISWGSNP